MHDILARQRQAQWTEGSPNAAVRIDRLDRAIGLLVDHAREIADALRDDFGHRSVEGSLVTDVAASIEPLKHARRHVRRWMRRERRSVSPAPLALLGARAWVDYQPKGIVGLISPWNFPFNLTFAPLAGILAAGNRVMIKPSEFTPRSSELMRRMLAKAFDANEVAVITGGPDVGEAFSALPFDHLLFTGSTAVGRKVMAAAAPHLTPVTLELGGKAPAVVCPDFDLAKAASRIATGKWFNAGQTCIGVDYVLVDEARGGAFVEAIRDEVVARYPGFDATRPDSIRDYTRIINDAQYARLRSYVDDARARGTIVVEPLTSMLDAPSRTRMENERIFPPTLLAEPPLESDVMRNEIFGPILPILTYRTLDEAIERIRSFDRPLALYPFSNDARSIDRIVSGTLAGGVTVNDTLLHFGAHDLPFGGIGPSGIGAIHGRTGFDTFSKLLPVFRQRSFAGSDLLKPPYRGMVNTMIRWLSK